MTDERRVGQAQQDHGCAKGSTRPPPPPSATSYGRGRTNAPGYAPLEPLILRYGLFAVFAGSAIEGEPFALAGGVLAHRHLLSVPAALLAAIGGALFVDQLWFHLARRARHSRIVRGVAKRPAFARSLALIERHPVAFALLFRFAYGLRAVAPVAIGASRVDARLFVPLNVVAAIVWGGLFTALGYALGPSFAAVEARYGTGLAVGGVVLSALVLALALRRGR